MVTARIALRQVQKNPTTHFSMVWWKDEMNTREGMFHNKSCESCNSEDTYFDKNTQSIGSFVALERFDYTRENAWKLSVTGDVATTPKR